VAPLSAMEKALYDKAEAAGVKMKRGYVITGITGSGKLANGRYKTMLVNIAEWDGANKQLKVKGRSRILDCDLLVVAMGGGASGDQIVLETLGFSYEVLKADNYGVYGIYEGDPNKAPYDTAVVKQFRDEIKKIGIATDLSSAQHNHLLLTLKGCTAKDFEVITKRQQRLANHAGRDRGRLQTHGVEPACGYEFECRRLQNIDPARATSLQSVFPGRHSGRCGGYTASGNGDGSADRVSRL
jgi:hypothetical protein